MVPLGTCTFMLLLQVWHSYEAYASFHFIQMATNVRADKINFPMLVVCFDFKVDPKELWTFKSGMKNGNFVGWTEDPKLFVESKSSISNFSASQLRVLVKEDLLKDLSGVDSRHLELRQLRTNFEF